MKQWWHKILFAFTLIIGYWALMGLVQDQQPYFNVFCPFYAALVAVNFVMDFRQGSPSEIKPSPQFPKPQPLEPRPEKSHEELLLEVIKAKGKAKRKDLLPHVAISKASLVRLLNEMEAKGVVRQVGERKAAYYELPAAPNQDIALSETSQT